MDFPESKNVPSIESPFPFDWVNVLFGIVIGAIVLFSATLGYFVFFQKKQTVTTSTKPAAQQTLQVSAIISGMISFNGYAPEGASIVMSQRSSTGHDVFAPFTTIPAINNASWEWGGAFAERSYEIQASLLVNGKTQDVSNILPVAAPAVNQILHIQSTMTAPPKPATITGMVGISGYIPANSTISIMGKKDTDLDFVPIATGLAPINNVSWSWNGAVTGSQYEFRAFLQQGTTTLVKSEKILVNAPAQNEIIYLTSTLTPPTPSQVSIGGVINLNGTIPSGSVLSVWYRPTGTSQFEQVVTNLYPQSGTIWIWKNALSGSLYDMQASLTQGSTTIAQSSIITVPAPTDNVVLTINAPAPPPAPQGSNTLTNTCIGKNTSTNLWQVQIQVNNNAVIQNMQQYRLIIGTVSGGNQMYDVTNSVINQSSPSITTGFIFTPSQSYFAQWQYATCSNCSTFSPFSQAIQISCQ